jgi:hypothetical protein
MKSYQKVLAVIALSGMCMATAMASEGEVSAKKSKKHHAEKTEEKAPCEACEAIKRLEEKVSAQQAEIDQLKGVQPAAPGTTDAAAEAAAAAAKQAADAAAAAAADANAKAAAAQADIASMKTEVNSADQEAQKAEKEVGELETPAYIHYKGIEFYPGGYLAAETAWRQHAEQTDVLSSFNGIPFASTPTANMTEFRGTGRQSRLAFKAIAHAGDTKLTGYYEMDFLGAAPTANENQSNSFTPRIRQAFGEAEWHGWSVTGGQAWSLLTLNKQGVDTLGWYNPDTIDAQYVVGFTFARLMTMRVAKSFDDKKVTAAFAIENSAFEQAGKIPSGVIYGGTGTASLGNSNTYTDSLAPDLIAKVAFDPSFGHFEVKAVGRFLRDRVEATSTLPAGETNTSNTTLAGGFGVDAYVPLLNKKLTLIGTSLLGRGVARYGDSSNVDFAYKPDGTISPLQNLQAMGGIEAYPTPKLKLYLYGGDEYIGQANYGGGYGYGTGIVASNASCFVKDSGTCSAEMRNLVQGVFGFWYDLHKGNYGTLKYGMQYSYTHKTTWADALGNSPTANDSMAFTSLRYVLP